MKLKDECYIPCSYGTLVQCRDCMSVYIDQADPESGYFSNCKNCDSVDVTILVDFSCYKDDTKCYFRK